MIFILGTVSEIKRNALNEVIIQYLLKENFINKYKILIKNVESNVPHTPYNEQTFQGANNRAKKAFELFNTEGDFFVGLESGLVEREGRVFEECWCVIYDKAGKQYLGYSSGFMLPENITSRMKQGESHIEILRDLEKELQIDSKDTWAIYSHNKIKRVDCIKESIRNALLSVNSLY